MKAIGVFDEMHAYENCGSIKDFIVTKVDYDKKKVIDYLSSHKRIAGCPREAIDCITGKKISESFSVFSDGEFTWCDFLIYHIQKYNIALPKDFVKKILA